MRHTTIQKTATLLTLVLLSFLACRRQVNDWVFYRTYVTNCASETDSLSGVKLAAELDKSIYNILGKSPNALVYDIPSGDENVTNVADAFYEAVSDTVTVSYSLILTKVYSVADLQGMKQTLRTYSFNTPSN